MLEEIIESIHKGAYIQFPSIKAYNDFEKEISAKNLGHFVYSQKDGIKTLKTNGKTIHFTKPSKSIKIIEL